MPPVFRLLDVPFVPILKHDPDLGARIEKQQRPLAAKCCQAKVVELPKGAWNGDAYGCDNRAMGLLVLSGVLCRRVAHSECYGAEILGPGDLLRPWDTVAEWSSLPTKASWTVIEEAHLAILDAEFAHTASRFPELATELLGRALTRSRYLTILIAIVSQRRIDDRLTLLFWHLADRFGQRRGEWIEIPVSLTHRVLSELVAARRPSVSTALAQLQSRGVLLRTAKGWKLRGAVPPELLDRSIATGNSGGAPHEQGDAADTRQARAAESSEIASSPA